MSGFIFSTEERCEHRRLPKDIPVFEDWGRKPYVFKHSSSNCIIGLALHAICKICFVFFFVYTCQNIHKLRVRFEYLHHESCSYKQILHAHFFSTFYRILIEHFLLIYHTELHYQQNLNIITNFSKT
jgi:hypothetical protein